VFLGGHPAAKLPIARFLATTAGFRYVFFICSSPASLFSRSARHTKHLPGEIGFVYVHHMGVRPRIPRWPRRSMARRSCLDIRANCSDWVSCLAWHTSPPVDRYHLRINMKQPEPHDSGPRPARPDPLKIHELASCFSAHKSLCFLGHGYQTNAPGNPGC